MEMLAKLLKNIKGDSSVIALVIMLVMFGVALPVGLMITGSLYTTVSSMDLGSQGNTTRTTLFNNIYSAYNLSVILPIVAAAGMVIAAIMLYFRWRSSST